MRIHLLAPLGFKDGTSQHALMLARAFAALEQQVTLISFHASVHPEVLASSERAGVATLSAGGAEPPPGDLNILVGLGDERSCSAARRLSERRERFVLAPTTYWPENLRLELARPAESLWCVSWDQASHARDLWREAECVQIVRCVVDTAELVPPTHRLPGPPWVLGRHSRDVMDKFGEGIPEFFEALSCSHDIRYEMLGAYISMSWWQHPAVRAHLEGSRPVRAFLEQCHLWVYSHAAYWRETACIALLEAMAMGLPPLVTNAGGMREYLLPGRTGFLCAGVEEFVNSARLLLDLPNLRREMGEQARQFVEESHSLASLRACLQAALAL